MARSSFHGKGGHSVTSSPPPPPPPPGSFTDVVDVIAAASGETSFHVRLPSGLIAAGGARSVTVGGTEGQADNVRTINGWVRGVTVSVNLPSSGQKRVALSSTAPSFSALSYPSEPTITINGSGPTGDFTPLGGPFPDWRNGAVCRERIYAKSFANNLRVHVHTTIWVTGKITDRLVYENGLSIPGVSMDGAIARGYTTTATRGVNTWTYTVERAGGNGSTYFDSLLHLPGARWVRNLGSWHNDAQCVPIGWAGDADEGTWAYCQWAGIVTQWETGVDPSALDVSTLGSVLGSVMIGPTFATELDVPISAAVLPSSLGGSNRSTAGTFPFSYPASTSFVGPFTSEQGGPGGNADIGLIPTYCLAALRHLGANSGAGWKMLRGVAFLAQGNPDCSLRSKATGVFHTNTEGAGEYDLNGVNGPKVGFRTVSSSIANYQAYYEPSHWGSRFWAGYAMTGEFLFAESQAALELHNYLQAPTRGGAALSFTTCRGVQASRHAFYVGRDHFLDSSTGHSIQERWMAWAIRTLSHTYVTLPDDDAKCALWFGWTATHCETTWDAVFDAAYTHYVSAEISQTRFPAGSSRHFIPDHGQTIYIGWQQGFMKEAMQHAYELGVLHSTNALAVYDWALQGVVNEILDDGFHFPIIIFGDFWATSDGVAGTAPATPAPNPAVMPWEVYEATRIRGGHADWPVYSSGSPETDVPGVGANMDWGGWWGNNLCAAVDRGLPGATAARTRFQTFAQRIASQNYIGPADYHARQPR